MWRKGFLVKRVVAVFRPLLQQIVRVAAVVGCLRESLFCCSQTHSVVHLFNINRFVFEPVCTTHIPFTLPSYPLSPGQDDNVIDLEIQRNLDT